MTCEIQDTQYTSDAGRLLSIDILPQQSHLPVVFHTRDGATN